MLPNSKQLASALKKYNEIMWDLCREHLTIGTELSEGTADWNLRDMVAEADYYLSTYHENGHGNNDLKYEFSLLKIPVFTFISNMTLNSFPLLSI